MTTPRDPTQFTRESAERIGRVVRAAELATPGARPLEFDRIDFSRVRAFRVATYTGTWSVGANKTVTFKYQTSTPNTVVATNLFFPVTNTASSSRDCAIAKEGTAWFLIDVRMRTATAVFVTGTQTQTFVNQTATGISVSSILSTSVLTDVTLSASLNTSACTIAIGKTLVTASRIFVNSTVTAMLVSGVSTGIFATSTVAATYLQME
jgi:hypothetical protein